MPCAGVSTPAPNELVVRVNYFGTLAVVEGLRGCLEKGSNPAVVMISSNSTTMTPGLPVEEAMAYLNGDEESLVARHTAPNTFLAYPAGKLAIAFWVRSQAAAWMASGIRLNAVAPGVIDTGMTRPLLDMPGVKDSLDMIPIPGDGGASPRKSPAPFTSCCRPTRRTSSVRCCSSTEAPTPCCSRPRTRTRSPEDVEPWTNYATPIPSHG